MIGVPYGTKEFYYPSAQVVVVALVGDSCGWGIQLFSRSSTAAGIRSVYDADDRPNHIRPQSQWERVLSEPAAGRHLRRHRGTRSGA